MKDEKNLQLQVSEDIWKERMGNLMTRRSTGGRNDNYQCPPAIADYKAHLSKVYVGKTLLDVGCGSMMLRDHLPEDVEYLGIDAFPMYDGVHEGVIETVELQDASYETVTAFAVLDGLYDLEKAIKNMKRIASKNIVFLTGVNIEPDEYHTIKIELEAIRKLMLPEFKENLCHLVHGNVYLLEYIHCKY